MSSADVIRRLRRMDGEELRFRTAGELRKAAGRVRSALAPPRWRRAKLASLLLPGASPLLWQAQRFLHAEDWEAAHRTLASHFAARGARFPLDPRTLDALRMRIAQRFPDAAGEASRDAEKVLGGRYDLLGYRDLPFGAPPAWHTDPVHNREAPSGFWSAIPYLSPQYGDHKVIWEINRHQHWLTLARAHQLTGDPRYYHAVVDQLGHWLENNPPLQGVNWASMLELAFRSLSWVWSLHFFTAAASVDSASRGAWVVDLLVGLDRQLSHIEQNLSQYFSPNTHLTGEALALYAAGCALPELRASGRRVATGRRILLAEIDRQINADGGHAESSAHYHRYSTDFYLFATLAARVAGDDAAAAFETAARRQARYLRTIADDGGRLPLLGDDDGGQLFPICGRPPWDCRDTLAAASVILDEPALALGDVPEEVFWLCGALPLEDMPRAATPWRSAALTDSGYYVSRTAAGDHLVFDAGRHGYLNAGHAHADALSLVLTIAGRPLLVDPGTATYTMSPADRDRFRSTAMHNTVEVNGRPQSEPEGPFHWRTTADARLLVWKSSPDFDYAEGTHDGYRPLAHVRGVLALHGVGWLVIDHVLPGTYAEVDGDGGRAATVTADAFWHLHPDWTATAASREGLRLRHHGGLVYALACSSALEILSPEQASGLDRYAPVYGLVQRATCIRAQIAGPLPQSFATFIPAVPLTDEAGLQVDVSAVPVAAGPGPSWHAAAFRLRWQGGEAVALSAIERDRAGTAGAPGTLWGSDEARTDARVALVPLSGHLRGRPVVIHGTHAEGLAQLASSVHPR
jgi:hypothetical protein